MTTSPLPWTTSPASNGGAFIKDSSGTTIALFSDYRDAELVVNSPADARTIDRLKDRIYDLEQNLKLLASK